MNFFRWVWLPTFFTMLVPSLARGDVWIERIENHFHKDVSLTLWTNKGTALEYGQKISLENFTPIFFKLCNVLQIFVGDNVVEIRGEEAYTDVACLDQNDLSSQKVCTALIFECYEVSSGEKQWEEIQGFDPSTEKIALIINEEGELDYQAINLDI